MSLTFSDEGVSASQRAFVRARRALFFILGAAIVVAAGWSFLQGPQLRSVSSGGAEFHERASSTVVLRSDRAIEPLLAADVTVSPHADFTVEMEATSLSITFDNPLLSNTTYDISVAEVTPRGWGRTTQWTAQLRTGTFDFLYLRDVGAEVRLVRASPHAANEDVIHQAQGIQGFAEVGAVIALLREDDEGPILELLDPPSGQVERIALPPGFEPRYLAPESWGTTLVLIADSLDERGGLQSDSVAMMDVLGDRQPEIVEGLSGEAVSVRSVMVSPLTGDVVLWHKNQDLARFDPLTRTLLPVGRAFEVWGFDAAGRSVAYVDGQGTLLYDLVTGDITRVARGELEGIPVIHEKMSRTPAGANVHRVRLPGLTDLPPYYLLTVEKQEGVHTRLTGSLESPESIGDLGLSRNGEYALVEVNPQPTFLGYPGLTRDQIAQGTVVRLIDVEEGAVVRQWPGHSFQW